MTVVARQRLFNVVFPQEESPLVSDDIKSHHIQSQQRKNWDIVTRILRPSFSQEPEVPNIEEGKI